MIRKSYVDTSGGQLHCRTQAGPGLPVVCLHQTASSSAMWVKTMQALEGQFGFVAFDTPGFGGSFDPPQAPGTMRAYADWIVEALDALGISRFHLLGHHTGVCIGAEIAVAHPRRVASASFIGPVPLTLDERMQFRQYYLTPMAPDADGAYLKQTWDYLRGLGAHGDLALHHRELVDTTRAYMGRFYAYSAVWEQDWIALFQRITAPMLLMCAPDDVLYPYFSRAQELRPDAQVAVLGGANFEPDLDPRGTAAALERFLTGLDTV